MTSKLSYRISSVDLFGLLICASAVMEYVPTISIRTGLFSMVFLAFASNAVFRFRMRFTVSRTGFSILCFVLCGLLSIVWGTFHGVYVNNWFRGIFPFSFLLTWFGFSVISLQDRYRLVHWLCISSLIWALRIFIEAGIKLYQRDLLVVIRLTTVIFDSNLPFALMAMPLFAFGLYKHGLPYRLVSVFFLYVILIWAGYRSMTLIAFTSIMMLSIFYNKIIFRVFALAFVALWIIISGGFFKNNMFNLLWTRFTSTSVEMETSRLTEWSYALDSFYSSPIIGKGIGWQVPDYVTFAGATLENMIEGINIPESAGYLHNVIAYMLMDLGMIGLIFYASIFVTGITLFRNRNPDKLWVAALFSLLSLLLLCQVQACFRLIQVNLMFVGLLKIITCEQRDLS